jgi:hypothetical protein
VWPGSLRLLRSLLALYAVLTHAEARSRGGSSPAAGISALAMTNAWRAKRADKARQEMQPPAICSAPSAALAHTLSLCACVNLSSFFFSGVRRFARCNGCLAREARRSKRQEIRSASAQHHSLCGSAALRDPFFFSAAPRLRVRLLFAGRRYRFAIPRIRAVVKNVGAAPRTPPHPALSPEGERDKKERHLRRHGNDGAKQKSAGFPALLSLIG